MSPQGLAAAAEAVRGHGIIELRGTPDTAVHLTLQTMRSAADVR